MDASVVRAASGSALTARQSGSRTRSSFPMPNAAARRTIFSATARRPSSVDGMPASSRQRPITTPPYLATSGKTASLTSSLPFTLLTIALPA